MDVTFSWDQLFANNIQLIGFLTGLLSVVLLIPTRLPKLQYWSWPMGVINAFAYFFIFRDWRLYGSTTLQLYFFIVSLLGVWVWRGQLFGRETTNDSFFGRLVGADPKPTIHATKHEFLNGLLYATIAFIPTYMLIRHYNDSSPFWDGWILSLSGLALFLQLYKRVQHWLVWIVVDLISIPLYASQGNGGTALLYVVFLIMCLAGFATWKEQARRDRLSTQMHQT